MGRENWGIARATFSGALAVLFLGLLSQPAKADPFVFAASNLTLSASATFEQIGNTLQLTLVNTSKHDVLLRSEVLTAIFFTLSDQPTLTPMTAQIGPGADVMFGVAELGFNVGGEWAYKGDGLKHAPNHALQGISSTGLGMFREPNFHGSVLQKPFRVAGLDYGITSTNDNPFTGKKDVTGRYALIQNSVVFTLTVPEGYNLSSITNVCFQYGTSRKGPVLLGSLQPNPEPVNIPEPGSMSLVACGIALLVMVNRCARRSRLDKSAVRVRRF